MNRRDLMLAAAASMIIPSAARAAQDVINMRDLYNKDLSFSDFALAHEGKRISASGFMAPPLKAESVFFVLTKRPMAVCPFCDTTADWPDDILAIYTKRTVEVIPFNVRIVTTGTLALGDFTDPDTGFLSRVRIIDATYGKG